MITLDIVRGGGEWDEIDDVEAICSRAAAEAARVAGAHDGDATLLLTDDAALRELNQLWRGQDKATNVLSFPAPANPRPMPSGDGARSLGDMAIAFETTVREAREGDKAPGDHLAHLVVHGILHLLGHDHGEPGEADAMEALEITALASLGLQDPYAGTVPVMAMEKTGA